MFSTICICFSTSISRSAACTCRVTPSRSAASCAPRRMSTKKGWFSVLSTSATVGLPVLVVVVSRLQASENARTTKMQPRRHKDTKKTERLGTVLPFQEGIQQHRHHDHAADDDLLQERRYTEQVQPVAQHAHDQGADQRASQRAIAAHQASTA